LKITNIFSIVKANVEGEAKERTADADLYAKRAEAEGVLARFEAESKGLQKLFETCNDPNIVMQYLMVDRNLYPELAKSMADGVRGMQPKINYWKTGGDVGNPISDVLKNIPASVDMLNSIGIKPPTWLMATGENSQNSSQRALVKTNNKD
jgi:flotillin